MDQSSRHKLKQYEKEASSRIVVVEDNADMREYLSTILSEDDHNTIVMEDGKKGSHISRTGWPSRSYTVRCDDAGDGWISNGKRIKSKSKVCYHPGCAPHSKGD